MVAGSRPRLAFHISGLAALAAEQQRAIAEAVEQADCDVLLLTGPDLPAGPLVLPRIDPAPPVYVPTLPPAPPPRAPAEAAALSAAEAKRLRKQARRLALTDHPGA